LKSFVAVIPARFGSTRLPGKPLENIAGQPMIWHVYQRALESEASRVLVATDDERIAGAVRAFGGEVVLTDSNHPTGTDRLAEVVDQLALPPEALVVNVQGDEPLLPAAAINQVAHLLADAASSDIATLCEPIRDPQDVTDPHQVKVVSSTSGRALYFSRAPIPNGSLQAASTHYRHIGLYAYRAQFLRDFTGWAPTPLEQAERLEQLRALEHDRHIQVAVSSHQIPPGVDTEADLERVRQIFGDVRV
jgi:3-deoxy-D-manno-octulosonate cytidylyltransferase